MGKIQRVQVRHRAENPRLSQSHFVTAEVKSLKVCQTLEGAACKGENPLGGGLYVETSQPSQTEENSIWDLLEVAVNDAQLLQPDEAPEAVGLQLADGEGVGADDGEGHGVVGRDDAEVGPLCMAVDGGEVTGELKGRVRVAPGFRETVPGHRGSPSTGGTGGQAEGQQHQLDPDSHHERERWREGERSLLTAPQYGGQLARYRRAGWATNSSWKNRDFKLCRLIEWRTKSRTGGFFSHPVSVYYYCSGLNSAIFVLTFQ